MNGLKTRGSFGRPSTPPLPKEASTDALQSLMLTSIMLVLATSACGLEGETGIGSDRIVSDEVSIGVSQNALEFNSPTVIVNDPWPRRIWAESSDWRDRRKNTEVRARNARAYCASRGLSGGHVSATECGEDESAYADAPADNEWTMRGSGNQNRCYLIIREVRCEPAPPPPSCDVRPPLVSIHDQNGGIYDLPKCGNVEGGTCSPNQPSRIGCRVGNWELEECRCSCKRGTYRWECEIAFDD